VFYGKRPRPDHIFVPAVDEHGIRNTGTGSLKIFVHHGPPLL
jgi:mannose-6-phosphate isomerase-like protein (cupin superfamily)